MAPTSFRDNVCALVESKVELSSRFTRIKRVGSEGGAGNFSLLFTAYDKLTSRDVALKFYSPAARSDAYRWSCFQREVAVLEKLANQKDLIQLVMPIEEFHEPVTAAGGFSFTIPCAYYALELAAEDVAEHLTLNTVSALEKLRIFHVMCRSVQRLHALGISHRDLKPSNFLRFSDGTIKLSDFGTARELTVGSGALLPVYNGPVGDMRYVAPELLIALHDVYPEISLRSDFFALGATFFEIFTGSILGPLVYNPNVIGALDLCMLHANGSARKGEFERVIGDVANRNQLPKIRLVAKGIPQSIGSLVQNIFELLCSLDYRKRPRTFAQLFLKIRQCIFILEHEVQYEAWRAHRSRIRNAKQVKNFSSLRTNL